MSKVSITFEGTSWGELVDQMLQIVGRIDIDVPPDMQSHKIDPAPPVEFKPFSPAAESWPVGDCPKHKKPWKAGQFGPYCTARDDTGPKGYCVLKPGDIWNGKNIPLVAA